MNLCGAFKCCIEQQPKVSVAAVAGDELDFLAPSVYHLATEFMDDIRAAGLDSDATIYDIENLRLKDQCGVIRRKGLGVKCPIDGRDNASYVHSLHGKDHVGRATFMLSYAWKYTVGDIIDSLENYCEEVRHKSIFMLFAYLFSMKCSLDR